MFLSIAITCQPATDLGFLLHKHPDRVHETELAFGKACDIGTVHEIHGAPTQMAVFRR